MYNQVIRTDLETNQQEVVPMELAIYVLSSYWDKDNIEDFLQSGVRLWTTYAVYSLEP